MRSRRWILLALGALVVGAAFVVVRWMDRGPEPPSVDRTVDRFREDPGEADDGPVTPGLLRPSEGVYRYAGGGDEELSVLGTRQSQGPDLPATVRHDGDRCWSFELEYNTAHSQSWRYCDVDGVLVEMGGDTEQAFDFGVTTFTSVTTFDCDPPAVTVDLAREPGESWTQRCAGADDDTTLLSVGPYTYVGTEVLDIGGDEVPALRYRQERDYEGDQRGTSLVEAWFSPETGLPLRNERTTRIESPSPIGAVTYTEEGWFQLVELEPRR